jgi:hypothetical protein
VGLRPIASLLPHEETIPSQIQRVADELRMDGVQKDPLIVDGESGVVLDGMHRLAALTHLGLGYAVCCSVDYSSSGISVKRWARVYTAGSGGHLLQVLDELGLAKVTSTEALNSLESRRRPVAVLTQRRSYTAEEGADLAKGFEVVRSLDELSSTLGWKRTFVPEDEVDVHLQDDRNAVTLVSRLGKQDVVMAGMRKTLFPCKTSMHVIDPRPVGANIPLDELSDGSRHTLDTRLKSGHVVLPPNSEYGGRRYKERLVVLGDH